MKVYSSLTLSLSVSLIKICSIAAQPICLPDPTQDYDNVSTVVTGWGQNHTDPKDTSFTSILQEGNLTTIPNSQCQEFKWENEIAMKFLNMKITDNIPYHQIGITSFGDTKIEQDPKNPTKFTVFFFFFTEKQLSKVNVGGLVVGGGMR